jgi:hypothetical protein
MRRMRLLRDHDSSRFLFLQPADYPGDKGNSRAKFSAFEDEFEFEHEERFLRFGAASQRDSENKGSDRDRSHFHNRGDSNRGDRS